MRTEQEIVYEGTTPAPPVVSPARKTGRGWIIAGAIVAALGIGAAVSNGSPAETLGREAAPVAGEVIEDGLTPAMLVDSLEPSLLAEFCGAYAGIDPSMARILWDQAYNDEFAGTPGVPSSSALWYEITSRC